MKQMTEKRDDHYLEMVRDTPKQVTLNVQGLQVRMKQTQQGADFVFGISMGCVVAIPLHRIATMQTGAPPPTKEIDLISFLHLQRVPVQLELETGDTHLNCWLLNVVENWLRISSSTGVEWAPITALLMAKIDPVDKSLLFKSH
jgi:hypothetical protein